MSPLESILNWDYEQQLSWVAGKQRACRVRLLRRIENRQARVAQLVQKHEIALSKRGSPRVGVTLNDYLNRVDRELRYTLAFTLEALAS